MNKYFEQLEKLLEKPMAIQTARSLFDWDAQTLAPNGSAEHTAKVIGVLSDEYMGGLINDPIRSLLEKLQTPKEHATLSLKEKGIVKELAKSYQQLESIPPEEYRAYNELLSISGRKWAEAKAANDFQIFAPYLEQVVNYKKKFADYRAKEGVAPYDILLSDYEEGFGIKELDLFFHQVKEELVPLLKKVSALADQVNKDYNYLPYDVEKQKEFCDFISRYIEFDFNCGVLAESAHPFTLALHNHDVRITTHYYEHNLESSIFSVIHEIGHGIYERNIDDSITQTLVGAGSMGVHESQSRFYENIIGRSKSFWIPIYDKLVSLFPENLSNVSLDQFILGINKSMPSLIRTEADELSYSLHIIIRYEIEKMLIHGEITVAELPAAWNKKYEEYMGIIPPTDSVGVLQDTHWSWGEFGYFPSYAIGSAISAQLYAHMKNIMPFDEYLLEGNIKPIQSFLSEHIHQYGLTKTANEMLLDITGETFNANYYVQYLKEKYHALYQLS